MRVGVIAVGKMRRGPEQSLIDDYAKRCIAAGRRLGLTFKETQEVDAPRGLVGDARRERESSLLLKALAEDAHCILLDEKGENLSSDQFAQYVRALQNRGTPAVALVIGGADGHAQSLRRKSNKMVAFGAATWPHMLVRVMVWEQLYRATTIIEGHPYHRQ